MAPEEGPPQPPEPLTDREARVPRHEEAVIRVPGDPADADVRRWFDTSGSMGPVRAGNRVTHLIDGPPTLRSMVDAISTAQSDGHFIYLLGWFLDDSFWLPGMETFRSLMRAKPRSVQIRAMLWNQWGTQNSAEVDHINDLPNGAAILDDRHLNLGSHHQKVIIVNGTQGLIGFCGGVDINPDRLIETWRGMSGGGGSPMHDVHCRIKGPAAYDLLNIFNERWDDHPDHASVESGKGALHGPSISVPAAEPGGRQYVQITRTYGNGSRHRGISGGGYSFARSGERTCRQMILHAIRQARQFIYMEEQYLVNMEAANALRDALPNIRHLTILIPHGNITDCPQRNYRRWRFIQRLRQTHPDKVRTYCLGPPGRRHTYVHSKMFIMDDQFAIIGSANCNRRGWTHDSEVMVGIADESSDAVAVHHFAHQLRIALWAEHLGLPPADLVDGVASATHWLSPRPRGARIQPYGISRDDFETAIGDPQWNNVIDPDGS